MISFSSAMAGSMVNSAQSAVNWFFVIVFFGEGLSPLLSPPLARGEAGKQSGFFSVEMHESRDHATFTAQLQPYVSEIEIMQP